MKFAFSKDDPFASLFINEIQYLKGKQNFLEQERKREKLRTRGSNVPNSDTDESVEESERDNEVEEYKDERYFQLPLNVRRAIDVAKSKKKHSDFYYRLRLLNDKI
jgi:hypothetical protein